MTVLGTQLEIAAKSLGESLSYWTLDFNELEQIFVDIWDDGLKDYFLSLNLEPGTSEGKGEDEEIMGMFPKVAKMLREDKLDVKPLLKQALAKVMIETTEKESRMFSVEQDVGRVVFGERFFMGYFVELLKEIENS